MSGGPVAFYAPLKAPDDATPSGDRRMAQLLLAALERAGYRPEIACRLRTFDGAGDRKIQERLRAEGEREAERLIAEYGTLPPAARPRAWFTYHVYYKAPDWTGPRVAAALGIPYAVAEGSRAAKRAGGPWALGHEGAERALDAARLVFVMTENDRPSLEALRPAGQELVDLPPFVDVAARPSADAQGHPILPREGEVAAKPTEGAPRAGRTPPVSPQWGETPSPRGEGSARPARLLTVAMMRPGDKLASYRLLAEALGKLGERPWQLTIAGDGPARADVEALFAPFGERVRLAGRVDDAGTLARLYADAHLFVWPAVNEAYGMVLLEAQAEGCPVVAGDEGGVASVVRHGETGLLTPARDADAFAAAVAGLVEDGARRGRLAAAARRFVQGERSLDHAAVIIADALSRIGVRP